MAGALLARPDPDEREVATFRGARNLGHIVDEDRCSKLVNADPVRSGDRYQSASYVVGEVHRHRHIFILRSGLHAAGEPLDGCAQIASRLSREATNVGRRRRHILGGDGP